MSCNVYPLSPTPPRCTTGPLRTHRSTVQLQSSETIFLVITPQRISKRDTKGLDCLLSTEQCIILAASALDVVNITKNPPPNIHCFVNVQKFTVLQAFCALTYAGHNLYLPTSFCQNILQGHILEIPDPGATIGLSPVLTPRHRPDFEMSSNAQ